MPSQEERVVFQAMADMAELVREIDKADRKIEAFQARASRDVTSKVKIEVDNDNIREFQQELNRLQRDHAKSIKIPLDLDVSSAETRERLRRLLEKNQRDRNLSIKIPLNLDDKDFKTKVEAALRGAGGSVGVDFNLDEASFQTRVAAALRRAGGSARVRLDLDDADFQTRVRRAIMRASGSVKVRMDLDEADFRARVRAAIAAVDVSQGKITVPVEPDFNVARLRADMAALDHGKLHLSVEVDTARARVELDRLIHEYQGRNINLNTRVSRPPPGGGGGAGGEAGALGGGSGGLGGLGGAVSAVSGFVAAIAPMTGLVLGGAAAIGSLVGVVTALTAALGPAVVMLGTFLPFAIGGLLGVVGSLALAFHGVGAALKEMNTNQQNAAQTGAQQAKTARDNAYANQQAMQQIANAQYAVGIAYRQSADQQITSTESVKAAEQGVANAQYEARLAQHELTLTRRDALRTLQDMNAQLKQDALDQRGANLSVIEAKKNLDAALADPHATELQRQQAQLAYDEAKQHLTDINTQTKRNQTDTAVANKKGVEGSDSVKAAVHSQQQSIIALGNAQQSLTDALRTQREGAADSAHAIVMAQQALTNSQQAFAKQLSDQQFAAQQFTANLHKAFNMLSPLAKQLVLQIMALKPAFKDLVNTAQQNFFPQLMQSIRLLTSPQMLGLLKQSIAETSKAFGDLFLQGAKMMSSPAWRGDLATISHASAQGITNLGQAGLKFANILKNVMAVASPFWVIFTKGISNTLTKWDQFIAKARQSGQLTAFFQTATTALHLFNVGLGNLFGAFVNVLKAALPYGMQLLRVFDSWSAKLKTNTKDLKDNKSAQDFFKGAIVIFHALAVVVGAALKLMVNIVKAFAGVSDWNNTHGKALTLLFGDLLKAIAAVAMFLVTHIIKGFEALSLWYAQNRARIIAFWKESADWLKQHKALLVIIAGLLASAFLVSKLLPALATFAKIQLAIKGITTGLQALGIASAAEFAVAAGAAALFVVGIIAAAKAFNDLYKNSQQFRTDVAKLGADVQKLWHNIWSTLKPIFKTAWDDFVNFFKKVWPDIINVVDGVVKTVDKIWSALGPVFKSISPVLNGMFAALAVAFHAATALFGGFLAGLRNIVDFIKPVMMPALVVLAGYLTATLVPRLLSLAAAFFWTRGRITLIVAGIALVISVFGKSATAMKVLIGVLAAVGIAFVVLNNTMRTSIGPFQAILFVLGAIAAAFTLFQDHTRKTKVDIDSLKDSIDQLYKTGNAQPLREGILKQIQDWKPSASNLDGIAYLQKYKINVGDLVTALADPKAGQSFRQFESGLSESTLVALNFGKKFGANAGLMKGFNDAIGSTNPLIHQMGVLFSNLEADPTVSGKTIKGLLNSFSQLTLGIDAELAKQVEYNKATADTSYYLHLAQIATDEYNKNLPKYHDAQKAVGEALKGYNDAVAQSLQGTRQQLDVFSKVDNAATVTAADINNSIATMATAAANEDANIRKLLDPKRWGDGAKVPRELIQQLINKGPEYVAAVANSTDPARKELIGNFGKYLDSTNRLNDTAIAGGLNADVNTAKATLDARKADLKTAFEATFENPMIKVLQAMQGAVQEGGTGAGKTFIEHLQGQEGGIYKEAIAAFPKPIQDAINESINNIKRGKGPQVDAHSNTIKGLNAESKKIIRELGIVIVGDDKGSKPIGDVTAAIDNFKNAFSGAQGAAKGSNLANLFGFTGLNPKGLAFGGAVGGAGGPRDDNQLILASPGEHMWTADEVQAVGGHGAMYAMRSMAKRGLFGYAEGGEIHAGPPAVHGPGPVDIGPGIHVNNVGSDGRGTVGSVLKPGQPPPAAGGTIHFVVKANDGLAGIVAKINAAAAALAGDAGQWTGGKLTWPVPGHYDISQHFGSHPGIDIPAPLHTLTVAANAGTVVSAGADDPAGYGSVLRILGQGVGTLYGHQLLQDFKVGIGDLVKPGQPVGGIGALGNSTGAHLHFEVHPGGFKSPPVDPEPYLHGTVPGVAGGPQGTGSQLTNAKAIAAVALLMGFGTRGIEIGFITALAESGLENLNYGDRDSLGLFQQRPSQGWGTRDQILNPSYAAAKFYQTLATVGWQSGDMGAAAQAVQRSGFPGRYDQMIPQALTIMHQLGYASGGPVAGHMGARQGTSPDTVPAMLQPGEFVMKKKAVDKLGLPMLFAMNDLQYFASGGPVKAMYSHEPNVSLGSRGQAVRDLQFALDVISGARLPVDGVFGFKTLAAVDNLQKFFKIAATGRVDHNMWAFLDLLAYNKTHAIRATPSGLAGSGAGVFSKEPARVDSHNRGSVINDLKSSINNIMGSHMAANGVYDYALFGEIFNLQKFFHMKADGVVTPQFWHLLDSLEKTKKVGHYRPGAGPTKDLDAVIKAQGLTNYQSLVFSAWISTLAGRGYDFLTQFLTGEDVAVAFPVAREAVANDAKARQLNSELALNARTLQGADLGQASLIISSLKRHPGEGLRESTRDVFLTQGQTINMIDLVHWFNKGALLPLLSQALPKSSYGTLLSNIAAWNRGVPFAGGGKVGGTGEGDIVPAWLTPGEFVMRKKVVQRLGTAFFDRLNGEPGGLFSAGMSAPGLLKNMRLATSGMSMTPAFANGGPVGDNIYSTTSGDRMIARELHVHNPVREETEASLTTVARNVTLKGVFR